MDETESCPVCDSPDECAGYPHLWRRMREDPATWYPIHEIVNGLASPIHEAARAAALIAQYPPDPATWAAGGRPCGACPGSTEEGTPMDTSDLIAAALAAKSQFESASADMGTAAAVLRSAADTLAAANQALHDDLAANGPAAEIDEFATPIKITLYTAVDPDTYAATPIRVA
jgi:hypothetical protein